VIQLGQMFITTQSGSRQTCRKFGSLNLAPPSTCRALARNASLGNVQATTKQQGLSEQEVTVEIQLAADLVEKLDRLQQEFGLRSRSTLIQKLLEGVFNEDEISPDDL